MAYTHTTFAQLKTALATRLSDPNKIYWTDSELGYYIYEALQTWGLMTGYWRDSGTLDTVDGTAFYDITTLTNTDSTPLLSYTTPHYQILDTMSYQLLEPSWINGVLIQYSGSEQFVANDFLNAIQRRRDALLAETGANLTQFSQNLAVSSTSVDLPDTTLSIRRMSWKGQIEQVDWPLFPEDISNQRNYSQSYLFSPGTPQTYSSSAEVPLRYRIAPPPAEGGALNVLAVLSGSTFAAVGGGLDVPDDMGWVVKWGALADMLGKEGPAQDLERAYYCERRWNLGVALAHIYPTVIDAEINGISLSLESISNLDQYQPNWATETSEPTFIASLRNYIALSPCPDGVYSVLLSVVRKAPLPVAAGDYIEIGREYLDPLLDYCEHLAAFKCGGYEFRHTFRAADNFFKAALSYNNRLAAQHPNIVELIEQSTRDDYIRPMQSRYPNPSLEAVAKPGDDVNNG